MSECTVCVVGWQYERRGTDSFIFYFVGFVFVEVQSESESICTIHPGMNVTVQESMYNKYQPAGQLD